MHYALSGGWTYSSCCSMHCPCTQGWPAQWSVPERHRGPWVLGGHRQWNPLILSTHVPPLMHGFEMHSLISSSHFNPIRMKFGLALLFIIYFCFSILLQLFDCVYPNKVHGQTNLYIQGCTDICTRWFHPGTLHSDKGCWHSHLHLSRN